MDIARNSTKYNMTTTCFCAANAALWEMTGQEPVGRHPAKEMAGTHPKGASKHHQDGRLQNSWHRDREMEGTGEDHRPRLGQTESGR